MAAPTSLSRRTTTFACRAGDVESWLDSDKPLDEMRALGPKEFVVRPVKPAVISVLSRVADDGGGARAGV